MFGRVIKNANQKTAISIAQEMKLLTENIRAENDPFHQDLKKTFSIIPGAFSRLFQKIAGFIFYTLNFWISGLGVERDAFGSASVSSIDTFGIEEGYSPLDPYARCPITVVVGTIMKQPVVIDDQIIIRPILKLGFTFDHRLIDGFHGARLANRVKEYLENVDSKQ